MSCLPIFLAFSACHSTVTYNGTQCNLHLIGQVIFYQCEILQDRSKLIFSIPNSWCVKTNKITFLITCMIFANILSKITDCTTVCKFWHHGQHKKISGYMAKDWQSRHMKINYNIHIPSPATWAPRPRELPGASIRSARLTNWPSFKLNTRLEVRT